MKKYIRLFVAFTIFLFVITEVYSQERTFSVQFKNGKFLTGKKLARGAFSTKSIEKSLYGNSYFVLVQFSNAPSNEKEKSLAKAGIQLHQYVSENAYLATVSKKFDFFKVDTYGITTINSIPKQFKIDRSLAVTNLTQIKENEKVLGVSYYPDMDKDSVISILKRLGAEIHESKIELPFVVFVEVNSALIDSIAQLPFVSYLQIQTLKDKTLNYNSIAAHGISSLQSDGGKNLKGQGVTIGIGDNSEISGHVDFSGRVISRSPWIPSNHGTHTAGTAGGAGILNVQNQGMAPKVTLIDQYFSDIITNAPTYYNDHGMVLTNNSYYASDDACPGNGEYDILSQYADIQLKQFSEIMHVVASGNDGDLTCSPYPSQFGTVKSGWQTAKNVLTVGAIKTQDYTNASFSSRGPANDGRLKPEITAGGWQVNSAIPTNSYLAANGTSMASPAVTGALSLMYQRYRQINGGANPKGALMKAIICNTAEDLGNAGPDYTFGFGMMNVRRAINVIDSATYLFDQISGGSKQHTITVPSGVGQLKVMLYWVDEKGTLNAPKALVNDLDLKVITPSLVDRLPLVLNSSPANVNLVATEGVDRLNNIEQVVISNPTSGNYTIDVSAFSIPMGSQEYVITYEILPTSLVVEYPSCGEKLVPGETEKIRWTTVASNGNTFKVEYSTNNGQSWTSINNSVAANLRYLNWTVPTTVTDSALIKVSQNLGSLTGVSDFPFSVLKVPTLAVTKLCEGYVSMNWTNISGITSYDILMLDKDTMKVIGNTNDTFFILSGLNKYEKYWLGVRAKQGDIIGRRSISISVTPNGGNCTEAIFLNDIKVDTILAPSTARQFFSNQSNATQAVKIVIRNLGNASVTTPFTVSYSCEGGSATEPISVTIPAKGTYTYTFVSPFIGNPNGFKYNFKAWTNFLLDGFVNNDTAYKHVAFLSNPEISSLPIFEGFETADSATYKSAYGIAGNDAVDFKASTHIGRARTFVNTGFARSGVRAITLDQSPYGEDANADSLYITYNLQSYTSNQLRLDFYYKNHGQAAGDANKVWIKGSEFDNWIEAYNLYDNQAELGGWKQGVININELFSTATPPQNVSSTFQIKFGQEGYTSANSPYPDVDLDDGYTFDDIQLKEVFNDIGIIKMVSPTNSCELSAANPIAVELKNYNNYTLNNIQVSYQIDGGSIISETITTLTANQKITHTFIQTADLSLYKDYEIKVWVNYIGDSYPENDTVSISVRRSPLITTFPYLERFENSDGNYYTKGKNSTWEWGVPAAGIINKAANGSKAWVTNLDGRYKNNELSYLYSPCFDISGLTEPKLSFAHIFDIETDYDYTWVEYSTNGTNWQKLGAPDSGTNWYDNPFLHNWRVSNINWHVATIPLPQNESIIRFRFVLSADQGVTEEGIGIDDIHIFDDKPIYASTISDTSSPVLQQNGWYNFSKDGERVLSLLPNDQNVESVTTAVYPHPTYVLNGKYYLGRNWAVHSSTALTYPITLRLFFTDMEVNTLIAAPACSTCVKPRDAFELGVTSFVGFTENGSMQDNSIGAYSTYSPSLVDIVPYDNGYYAEVQVNNWGEFWLGKSVDKPLLNASCSNGTITFTAVPNKSTYQWQADTGSGFENISNNGNYTGTQTNSLLISNLTTVISGTLYRCLVEEEPDYIRQFRLGNIWTGVADTNWFNTSNWSCGTIPDAFTDVILLQDAPNYPIVPSSAAVKSIRVLPTTTIQINEGVNFEIKGE